MEFLSIIFIFTAWVAALFLVFYYIFGMWILFLRAGISGWKVLIPIYNWYLMAKVGGLEGWVGLLGIIPGLGIVVLSIIHYKIAKAFGRSEFFAICNAFLPNLLTPVMAIAGDEWLLRQNTSQEKNS